MIALPIAFVHALNVPITGGHETQRISGPYAWLCYPAVLTSLRIDAMADRITCTVTAPANLPHLQPNASFAPIMCFRISASLVTSASQDNNVWVDPPNTTALLSLRIAAGEVENADRQTSQSLKAACDRGF